jgi:hypothetical protein
VTPTAAGPDHSRWDSRAPLAARRYGLEACDDKLAKLLKVEGYERIEYLIEADRPERKSNGARNCDINSQTLEPVSCDGAFLFLLNVISDEGEPSKRWAIVLG